MHAYSPGDLSRLGGGRAPRAAVPSPCGDSEMLTSLTAAEGCVLLGRRSESFDDFTALPLFGFFFHFFFFTLAW